MMLSLPPVKQAGRMGIVHGEDVERDQDTGAGTLISFLGVKEVRERGVQAHTT